VLNVRTDPIACCQSTDEDLEALEDHGRIVKITSVGAL
jgi:hypothetical protein